MQIHHYHNETGEYVGTTEAFLDPIEKTPLIPAYATNQAPPEIGVEQVAVFGGDSWTVKDDYRGKEYWSADKEYLGVVDFIGSLPSGATTVKPLPSFEGVEANKKDEIKIKADVILQTQAEEYGAMEIATWDQQFQEAVAYSTDNQATVPLLNAIAAGRGMTVSVLADRIIANRTAWVALSGRIVGQRLAYQDSLDAARTVEEVEAIEVNYVA